MKDYNKEITYESYESFIEYSINKGYQVNTIEGFLNNTYVIYNVDKKLSIRGVKARDYIVIYPKFLNEWGNSFHILMTDNINKLPTEE